MLLFIYFIDSSVYLLIQIPNLSLPHPISLLVTINLFSISVSLFLLCKQVHLCHILDSHKSNIIWYLVLKI